MKKWLLWALLFASTAWGQDYVLVVPASSKISGVTELIAEATARPDDLTYGTYASSGRGHQVAAELFARMTRTHFTRVPYKTEAEALAALLEGKLAFMFASVPASAPHVDGGRLRAFAVTGSQRAGALPKVPTMAEAGFGGFDEAFARSGAR
jgi:tripartite-type tricarboxylate transporter receptor subunit TctC